jgi:glyoxylase-like metal-dependent hydrolase (beta-lactamase superfamily II)
VDGVAELLELNPVKVYAHKLEADGVKKVTGITDSDIVKVDSGDKLDVGDVEVEFLHTPGHTPGSQCFRIKQTLVSGDTLFIDGCGRVDLPGSNSEDMYHSIQKLASLPDDTILLPGHNYSSVPHATMGETKQHNTYMRINDLETWKTMMGG